MTRSMALQDKGAASRLLSLQCHGDIHRAEWLGARLKRVTALAACSRMMCDCSHAPNILVKFSCLRYEGWISTL